MTLWEKISITYEYQFQIEVLLMKKGMIFALFIVEK